MENLREQLTGYKKIIIDNRKSILNFVKQKNDLTSQIKEGEDKIKDIILNEKDANGKPLHSNAEKRNIAFNKVIGNDPAYTALVTKVDELNDKMKELELQIEEAKYNFKIEEILSCYVN